jgi:hypothetical protein
VDRKTARRRLVDQPWSYGRCKRHDGRTP